MATASTLMGNGEKDSLPRTGFLRARTCGREIHSSFCQSGKSHNVYQPPSLLSNRFVILRPNLPSLSKDVYDLQAAELAYRTCVHSTTYHLLTVSTLTLISSCPTRPLNVGYVLHMTPQPRVPKNFREGALATPPYAELVEHPFSGSLESTRGRRSMWSRNVPRGYLFPISGRVLVGQGVVLVTVRGGRRLPVMGCGPSGGEAGTEKLVQASLRQRVPPTAGRRRQLPGPLAEGRSRRCVL